MLNAVALQSEALFSDKVRLFPPGFPREDDSSHDTEVNLKQLRDEYRRNLDEVKVEADLIAQQFTPKLAESVTPSTLESLATTISELQTRIVQLKQDSEAGLLMQLSRPTPQQRGS